MSNTEVRIDGVPQEDPEAEHDATAQPVPGETESEKACSLEEKVIDQLRQVYDPEIPVNIYELGLIYDIDGDNKVTIKMTLTSPACPVAESLPVDVRGRINRLPDVADCDVEIVWEPTWGPDRMSEVAKVKLGMM